MTKAGLRFVLCWTLATLAGTLVGILVFAYLFGLSGLALDGESKMPAILPWVWRSVVTGISFGASIGLSQWLVLRKHLPVKFWWVLLTAAGLVVGLFGAFAAMRLPGYFAIFFWISPGVIVGAVQSFLLHTHARAAWRWVLPSAFSWAMVIFTLSESMTALIIIPALSLITGAISGFVLSSILSRRGAIEPERRA